MKNLFPPIENWQSVAPYPGASPGFEQTGGMLITRSNGLRNCFGRWISPAVNISGGHYLFSVKCLTFDIRHKKANLHIMLTWRDSGGKLTQRDYVTGCETADGVLFERVVPVPPDSATVEIELCFKWSETGYVQWTDGKFHEAPAIAGRKVRVASAYAKLRGSKAGNLQAILDAIDNAAGGKPDILCLGETILSLGVPFLEAAVKIDDPEVTKIREKAKQYNMYIIVGLNLQEGEFYRNTAVLINRTGEIGGIYRKIQVPLTETESGYTPGDEFCVFETDFGKIAMMICWDQGFPEVARQLSKNDAEIIFVPTMWNAPLQARARAIDNLVFVVSSARADDGPAGEDGKVCFVMEPDGNMTASCVGGETNGYCVAEVDLEKEYKSFWFSIGPCYGERRTVLKAERRYDLY